MKPCLYIALILFVMNGCVQYDVIDTGLAQKNHDCPMWEYFHTDAYNWDSVIVAIEHAGLRDLFEGKDPDYPQITFFGMTNYSVKHFIMHTKDGIGKQKYNSIQDIPKEECRRMILCHVLKGRYTQDYFDYEIKNTLKGGTEMTALTGIKLRVYRTTSSFNDVQDIGPEGLGIHALVSGLMARVASSDIQTQTGIVHSLTYDYEWTEL